jgi:NAD(P)-dependent dehydrogenase (short-subunit alcohol dehydrogenase family)
MQAFRKARCTNRQRGKRPGLGARAAAGRGMGDMIDVNVKGVLYAIAEALPIFRNQGFGHFVLIASTAALKMVPIMAVYSATKAAVRTIAEGLRQVGGGQASRHDHHARVRVNGLRQSGDRPASKSSAHPIARRVRNPAGRDRPRNCVRDRAADRGRRERGRRPSDGAGIS